MSSTSTQAPASRKPEEAKVPVGYGMRPGGPSSLRTKWRLRILIVLGVIALVVISVLLYRHFTSWESTDDAQIDGYIYPISSRVAGYVVRVAVDDNQLVEAGTVLAELDPK